MPHRRFQIVWGGWMFEDWHLYRWRERVAALNPNIRWYDWVRVL